MPDKLGPPITVPIEGRRTEIPADLLCAPSLEANERLHPGDIEQRGESRGAADMAADRD